MESTGASKQERSDEGESTGKIRGDRMEGEEEKLSDVVELGKEGEKNMVESEQLSGEGY